MRLSQIIEGMQYSHTDGDMDIEITDIAYDSRKAVPGSLFVCIEGTVADGHQFIPAACERGAKALLAQKPVQVQQGVTVIYVENTRYALAYVSAAFFGHPSRRLKLIGVTGTKGKTTTAYMIKSILEQAGHKTGLIGTIETIVGERKSKARNTTPESYDLQKLFREMLDNGCDSAVMEVSSQGLMMERVAMTDFDVGIFTNISPDHIGPNEHASFADYLQCKSKLFRMCRHGMINIDDPKHEEVLTGSTCKVTTFGFCDNAEFRAVKLERLARPGWLGVMFRLRGPGLEFDITVGVPGEFNVYNALAAISTCLLLGVGPDAVSLALENIRVKGRLEFVPALPHFTLLIDYAHNAVSLENLLNTLRSYQPARLICLFGCGGNRARRRRFEMGEISGRLADFTILTEDNPRDEDPEEIIKDIEQGIKPTEGKYVKIHDRREAIRYMIETAQPGDIAVLAGKGHEQYQEIRGTKYHMDEREIVADVLKSLNR